MNSRIRHCALSVVALFAAGCGSSSSSTSTPGTEPGNCVGGMASGFSCSGITLRRRVPNDAMGGGDGNDLWGWFDAMTGNEYAIMGLTNGTAFVDVTDPDNPVFIGHLATNTVESRWRDMKVYMDHAYIVADFLPNEPDRAHGIQVFDLKRLRTAVPPENLMADAIYDGFEYAHNLAINEATGYAYAVGTNTFDGGLHIVDIRVPNNPMFAGSYSGADIHDTQCVLYQGPDPDHAGREICVSSSHDLSLDENPQVDITDVTDKSAPMNISTTNYPDPGFAHQGWLTEDHRYFLLGDESDEIDFNVPTRTLIFDVTDLDAPVFVSAYEAATASIDHNLYVMANRIFQANYTSGVRVLEFGDLSNMEIMEIAFFDTFPGSNAVEFEGLWSVYPFLPSGNIIASDRSNGLFILTLQ